MLLVVNYSMYWRQDNHRKSAVCCQSAKGIAAMLLPRHCLLC